MSHESSSIIVLWLPALYPPISRLITLSFSCEYICSSTESRCSKLLSWLVVAAVFRSGLVLVGLDFVFNYFVEILWLDVELSKVERVEVRELVF